jgi:hypothetical protein
MTSRKVTHPNKTGHNKWVGQTLKKVRDTVVPFPFTNKSIIHKRGTKKGGHQPELDQAQYSS